VLSHLEDIAAIIDQVLSIALKATLTVCEIFKGLQFSKTASVTDLNWFLNVITVYSVFVSFTKYLSFLDSYLVFGHMVSKRPLVSPHILK